MSVATTAAARPRPGRAAYRLMLRTTWRGGVAWTLVFAGLAASTVKGYEAAYPTPASRALLAATLLANRGFHALYGIPHAADTAGGFTAWRLGTVMALLAGVWMLLAATRLLRGEEDDGRWELLVSGATTPTRIIAATAAALATWLAVAFVALAAALAKSGLPAKGSLVLAGAVSLSGAVFVGVGMLGSQLVPIRRRASGLAGAFLGLTFLVRVVADGTSGVAWLRWLSPFGWVEEVRAFAGDRSATLLLLAGSATAVLAVALAIARRRDLGRGALFGDDTARGRDFGLGSSLGFALRRAIGPTAVWTVSLGAFAFVLGLLTKDIVDFAKSSPGAVKIINRLGGSLTVATGYLGFALSFAVLIAALYAGFRVAADREEEASGRLENVLVRPVGRRSWLLGSGLVAVLGATVVAVVAAFLTWAGAAVRGLSVPVVRLLEGGVNAVPAAALFSGLGLLVLAVVPRATVGLTLGAIAVSYLVQLVGALVRAPSWVLDLSVFHHVPPVPAVGADLVSASALAGLGLIFAVAGSALFARRDVEGA
jgi:ABC-2 type transport system permease protein